MESRNLVLNFDLSKLVVLHYESLTVNELVHVIAFLL